MKRKTVIALICALTMVLTFQPASAAKVKVTKVSWDSFYTHKTLKKGEKFKLKAKCLPKGAAQKFTYRSSKPYVAKVSKKGVVTARSNGRAVITVKAKKTKKSAKYYIHVGKKVKKVKWTNTGKTRVIYLGEPFTFKANCSTKNAAYKKVIYRSSKSSVIKISKKGKATPKKNGTATITAWAADQSGKKVRCKVTVKTRVNKVKLSAEYKTCFISESLQLSAAVSPEKASDKTLKWTSSNKNIATVSKEGAVKGKSAGKVKITATAKDGSKKKGTYTVYVRGPLDPASEKFIAHRGLSSVYPENTVQAFEGASAGNFNAIETDIWENGSFYQQVTEDTVEPAAPSGTENQSDGSETENETEYPVQDGQQESDAEFDPMEFIIMHDSNIFDMCGVKLKVKDLKENTIGNYPIIYGNGNNSSEEYRIPVLADYLDIIRSSGRIAVIEIKDDDLSEEAAEKLIKQIDERNLASRTFFGSFYKNSLLTLKKHLSGRSDIKLVRFLGARDKGNFENEISWCKKNEMDQVSMRNDYITAAFVKSVHDAGMQFGAWTVDDKSKAADLLLMGCDYITTNKEMW